MQFEFSTVLEGGVCQVRATKKNFVSGERVTDRPHKHYFMEFHCVFRGKETVDLPGENRRITLEAGQILLIPRDFYHCVSTEQETVDRICFYFSTEKGAFSAPSRQITEPTLFEDSYAMQLMELCRVELLQPDGTGRNDRIGLLMLSTALRLLSCKFDPADEQKNRNAAEDKEWIVLDYMEQHFTDPEGLAGLAKALYLSQRQASNLVKKYLGTDFKTAVRKRRMELADIYLRAGKLSLEEIAWQVGYRSYSGFQLSFKEHFGTTPSARRKAHENP